MFSTDATIVDLQNFFSPNIFNPGLVESMDEGPEDKKGELYLLC